MQNLSIKWKLSIAFIALMLSVAILYIAIAKNTFETDKTAYIFDTQERQLSQYAQIFNSQVNREIFNARAVLVGLDAKTNHLSESAQKLFQSDASLLGIELWRQGDSQPLLKLTKDPELWSKQPYSPSPVGPLQVSSLGGKKFLASHTSVETNGSVQTLRLIFSVDTLFEPTDGLTTILMDDDHVLISSDKALDSNSIPSALKRSMNRDVASTAIAWVQDRRYLVSFEPLRMGKFALASFMDADPAFHSIHVFYQRSFAFLLFAFFATIVISMLLAGTITRPLQALGLLTERIGRGDFTAMPKTESDDEVGSLARSFQRMIGEFQNLLQQTETITRQESELKTARLVQESLLPDRREFQVDALRLAAFNAPSAESSDWWYYYVQGDDLFVMVGDATTRGISGALITAAVRSLFSYLQRDPHPIREIVLRVDDAIYQCSRGRALMKAFLIQLNTRTGQGTFINAGHELPVLIRNGGPEFLFTNRDTPLGKKTGGWLEHIFQLNPGERLFIFTDGLMGIRNRAGGQIDELQFLKLIDQSMVVDRSPKQFVEDIFHVFSEFGEHQALTDDVTAVCIECQPTGGFPPQG